MINYLTGKTTFTSEAEIEVAVKPLPTAALSGTTSIYEGAKTELRVELTGAAPWSIAWSDGTISFVVKDIAVSPAAISVSPASIKTCKLLSVSDAFCNGTILSGSATVSILTTGTWKGSTDSDWNKASNWIGGVPTASVNAVIDPSVNQPFIASDAACRNLVINKGSLFTIIAGATL